MLGGTELNHASGCLRAEGGEKKGAKGGALNCVANHGVTSGVCVMVNQRRDPCQTRKGVCARPFA